MLIEQPIKSQSIVLPCNCRVFVHLILQFDLSPKLQIHNFLIPCRHNEDGSYTYGFEGADGSFKIETKAQTGEVKGKYGYVDETGKVRTN